MEFMDRLKPSEVNLVIYHANCADGFGAAYAAWRLLGERASYVACSHGDNPPNVKGKNVIIVDFSFPRDVLIKMRGDANKLLVLDHHISAKNSLEDLPYTHFDISHSGAVLAWKYFHPQSQVPTFVKYIEDRDLWKWEMDFSKEFSIFLNTVPRSFEGYAMLEDDSFLSSCIEKGKVLLEYADIQINNICRKAIVKKMLGLNVAIVNSCNFESEVGSILSKTCDFALIWHYDYTRDNIKVSLRSRDDAVDVSSIAAEYFGGGGHHSAAGFQVSSYTELQNYFD